VGNPGDIYPLLGTYVPFAPTQADREARHDPRLEDVINRAMAHWQYVNRPGTTSSN
jgi:hypothetical protein